MFEKVNPAHPDKVADRIAGALVDLAYQKENNPKIAVEVLIGHGICHIISETSVALSPNEVKAAVSRIAGNLLVDYREVSQDEHLADNQIDGIHCGDNGIFKGVPVTDEQKELTAIAKPSILVPSPNVTANHQEKNARVLEAAGGAAVLLEQECSGQKLFQAACGILHDEARRAGMASAMASLGVQDATERIYQAVTELIR